MATTAQTATPQSSEVVTLQVDMPLKKRRGKASSRARLDFSTNALSSSELVMPTMRFAGGI